MKTAQRIIRSLHRLTDDPYAHIKKLKGKKNGHPVYSFRIGLQYRAILSVLDTVLVIRILEIEDREQPIAISDSRHRPG